MQSSGFLCVLQWQLVNLHAFCMIGMKLLYVTISQNFFDQGVTNFFRHQPDMCWAPNNILANWATTTIFIQYILRGCPLFLLWTADGILELIQIWNSRLKLPRCHN